MPNRFAVLLAVVFGVGAVVPWPAAGADSAPRVQPVFGLAQMPAVLAVAPRMAPVGQRAQAAAEDLAPATEEDLLGAEEISDEDLESLYEDVEVEEVEDPLEPINRPIFEANLFLDRWLMRPVTRIYIETVPEPGRDGLSNVLENFETPVTLINDFLQGEMSRAGATFGRFFINSVFGLAGIFDVADALGLPGHEEDFGQTLGSYGVGDYPYLVLPLLGPSSPRDGIGIAVDNVIDPLAYLTPDALTEVHTGSTVLSNRAEIIDETDSLEATSLDFYAAVRSFYVQNRDYEIANGRGKEKPKVGATPGDGGLYDVLEEEGIDGGLEVDPSAL